MVARSLYETAVAALGAAAGEAAPGEGGLDVRPQNDLAAVSVSGRRRVDGGASVDAHRRRRRDHEAFEIGARVGDEALVRLAAAPVAANQHLAAAGAARRINPRARELDVLAGDEDRAALGAL